MVLEDAGFSTRNGAFLAKSPHIFLVSLEPLLSLMSRFGTCSARISGDRQTDTHTHTQTHRTTIYRNPRCACAPRVNNYTDHGSWPRVTFLPDNVLAAMAVSGVLSTLEVAKALETVSVEETRELVFHLGVPLNVLDDIASLYGGANRKHHFVQKWLDMFPDASWETLASGLRQIKKNTLAADVEFTHVPKVAGCSSEPPTLVSTASVNLSPAVIFDYSGSDAPPAERASTPSLLVARVKASIEHFENEFSNLVSDTRASLCEKEDKDKTFLDKFRDHLFYLPVLQKPPHARFFERYEDDILDARSIRKLFAILRRHCNYSNYEIIFHVVKKFCHELQKRMLGYRDSLIDFEMITTVDIFLLAISARPGGEIHTGFTRMVMKINKPASVCTLYEIRELKESIAEKASVHSYSMYIENPEEGSVRVVVWVSEVAVFGVALALTADFKQKHSLSDVLVGETHLASYLVCG